jgi:hypothetical protein
VTDRASDANDARRRKKIMEDPRIMEDLGDHSPSDLPRSAKLPR